MIALSNSQLKTELIIKAGVSGLDEIEAAIKQLRKTGANVDALSLSLNKARDEFDDLTPPEQRARLKSLSKAFNRAEKDSRKLAQTTNQTTKSFGRLKTIAISLAAVLGVTFVTRKITQFFGSAISGAAEFEEQIARVKAVSGATADEIAQISAKAKELGSKTRYTATQAAQGFEILARAGLSAKEQIAAIQPVLALAQGQSIEMAEAAQYITDAVVIMGGSFEEAGRYADVLAKGASQAATTVPELAKAISYTGQYAKETGMSIEELVAVLDLMANNGVRGERAGTALRNIFAQMQDPASKASQALRELNIDTSSLINVIEGIRSAGARGSKAINAFGTEAGPALRALLSGGVEAIAELNDELDKAAGTAQNAADEIDNTLPGALKGFQSAWQGLKTALATPILEPAAQKLREFADIIRDMTSSGRIAALGRQIAELFERGADKAIAFAKSINFSAALESITAAISKVGDAASRLGVIFDGLSVAFNTVKLGFYGIGLAASAVFTAIVGYFELISRIPAKLAGLFGNNPIAAFFEDINTSLKTLTDDLAQNTRALANDVQNTFGDINDTLNGTAQAVRAVTSEITAAQQTLNTDLSTLGITATSTAADIEAAFNRIIASTTDPEAFYAIRQELEQLQASGRLAVEQTSGSLTIITDKYDTLIQTLSDREAIAEPLRIARDEMKQMLSEVSIDAQTSVDVLNQSVRQMLDDVKDPAMIQALKHWLTEMGNLGKLQGELSVELYSRTTNAAFEAYEADQALAQSRRDNNAEIEKTIELQDKAAQSAREAFDRIGVDMEGVNSGIASGNKQMIRDLITGLEQTQAAGQDTAKLVGAAFDQMLTKLNSKEEFKALNEALKSTDTRAQLTTEQLAALSEGMREGGDAARDAAKSTDGYNSSLLETIRKARAARREAAKNRRANKKQTEAIKEKTKATEEDKKEIVEWTHTTSNAYDKATDAVKETGQAAQYSARDMASLANSAKDAADSIAASLAGIRGDTAQQAQIQQEQKLRALRERLKAAEKEGNGEAIRQYRRAINLQKQLFLEQQKKAQATAKPAAEPSPTSPQSDQQTTISGKDVAAAWKDQLAEAERRGAERAKQELAKELIDAGKRKAV